MLDNVKQSRYNIAMAKPPPRREPKTASIGLRTTAAIKERADAAAFRAHRSLSEWVEVLIVEALERAKRGARK